MRKLYTSILLFFLFILSSNSFGQIVANDDTFVIDTNFSTTTQSVLNNDTMNATPVVSSLINLSMISMTNSAFTLNTNGTITLIPNSGIANGTYNVTYQICEIANPTNCDVATVTISVNLNGSISLEKVGTYFDQFLPVGVSVGDTITYAFTVTNTGDVTLTNVTVTDSLVTVVGGPIPLLAVGASSSTTFTAVYNITQEDIDNGQVNNLATAIGTTPSGSQVTGTSFDPTPCTTCYPVFNCTNCTMTPLAQDPSVNVTLDGTFIDGNSDGAADVGETINYQIVVTNTGNTTLTNVTVSSQNIAVIGNPQVLAAGTSSSTAFFATYTITQQDLINGKVEEFVTAFGTPPFGPTVTDVSSATIPNNCTPITQNCFNCTVVCLPVDLGLNTFSSYNDFNTDGFVNVGDIINYTYSVSNYNSSNTLTSINLTSPTVTISGGPITNLPVFTSDNSTFTGVHVLTQTDINNGFVTANTTATGLVSGNSVNALSTNTISLTISSGIKLNAFLDYDGNGVQNSGEPNFNYGNFNYQLNGGTTSTITTSNGIFYLYESDATNSYNLSFTINPSYASQYSVSPSNYSNVTVPLNSGITIYNFAVIQTPYNDLAVYLNAFTGGPRPGFVYYNTILIKNNGTQTITSGTVTFTKDNALSISSLPVGATVTATGFTYNFTNLLPSEIRYIYVFLQVPTIPTVSLGQLVTNTASISIPTGDVDVNNNNASLTQDIRGAYDPNDKQESHGGEILHSTFTSNDYLTYTIRFENTGNANAITVRVDDVLDADLDETAIRMVDASHAYVLQRTGSNLSWKFDGIDLPPSVPNTQIGHGYITFQIKPTAGYAIGDIIPNFASIYFDFNPPIITNTNLTEFVTTLSNNTFAFNELNYYPNPVKNSLSISNASLIEEIEITSLLGQKILTKKINELQTELNLSELANGIYFVKVISEGQEKTIKIIKE